MAYRLDPARPASEEIRRVAGEQLAKAIGLLKPSDGQGDFGSTAHALRKRLKRLRSLLRLVRGPLEEPTYQRDMTMSRDMGRNLSAMRDADVLAGAVQGMVHDHPAMVPEYVDPIVRELVARRDEQRDGFDTRSIDDILSDLGLLSRHVEGWSLAGIDWETLMEGVATSYRRGRRASRVALAADDPEAFHEARKRTKDLWYQLELVRDAWRPVVSGTAKGAEEVADVLGELHDLDVLSATLHEGRGSFWNPEGADLLLEEIDRRLGKCRTHAVHGCSVLYAEKADAFKARLRVYASHQGTRSGADAA
jgi:CHAD domain-containing protein